MARWVAGGVRTVWLDQPGEAVADARGGAAIEAEEVLAQISLEVLAPDVAVMGAEQSALCEGED